MCGFANSVTEVLEVVDVLELLGFDNRTGSVVQDADFRARAISEAIEDITVAHARLHATECFLRQPTLVTYLAFVNAVPWISQTRKEMLANCERFLAAVSAIAPEPALSDIGVAAPVTLERIQCGAPLALGGDSAAAG